MNIFNQIKVVFNDLFRTPFHELEGIQIIILVFITIALFYLLKAFGKLIGKAFSKIGSGVKKKLSYTEKCKKISCRNCGRTLDKCQCQKNQGHGNFYRYRHWKKERKNKQ